MTVEGERGARGERGPTGDHGQDGVGEIGPVGETGPSGPMGHTGLTGVPPRNFLLSALRTLTVFCGCVVVVMALGIVVARQHTIDDLRDQIDSISADRRKEQVIEDCRDLFVNDVVVSGASLDSQLAHLFSVVVDTPEGATDREALITAEVEQLAMVNERSKAAAAAFDDYTEAPDAPGECSHPTAQGD